MSESVCGRSSVYPFNVTACHLLVSDAGLFRITPTGHAGLRRTPATGVVASAPSAPAWACSLSVGRGTVARQQGRVSSPRLSGAPLGAVLLYPASGGSALARPGTRVCGGSRAAGHRGTELRPALRVPLPAAGPAFATSTEGRTWLRGLLYRSLFSSFFRAISSCWAVGTRRERLDGGLGTVGVT